MENITIKINGIEVSAPKGSTILEAARLAHIEIPTLCYLKEINEIAACRMCVVEVKGARSLVASCVYPINENMEVWTNTPKVLDSRKKTLQLLLSNHDRKCLSCVRSGNCELQQLAKELGVDDEGKYDGERTPSCIDDSAAHMIRDNSKCILCRRCVAVCEKVQGIGDLLPGQVAGVGALQADHPRIAAQLPGKLSIAHIHSIDSARAILEHTVGKSPGRGPNIGANLLLQGDGPGVHGLLQLISSPAHILQPPAPDLQGCLGIGGSSRLVHLLPLHIDLPRHNEGLGLLPGLNEPLLNQKNVQSLFQGRSPP